MPFVQINTKHPTLTARRTLAYVFTPKHHGVDQISSCWLSMLTFDEEFAIFDRADGVVAEPPVSDNRQVANANGTLYGYELLLNGSQRLRELGTWHQQIAEYPGQVESAEWHGYPIWPIGPHSPPEYQGQKCRPDPLVFDRMVQLGDITPGQRKRLKKGDWV